MTVRELVTTTQSPPFEQEKALIKALFEQLPKTEPLVGYRSPDRRPRAASLHIRKLVSRSIQRSAEQLRDSEAE